MSDHEKAAHQLKLSLRDRPKGLPWALSQRVGIQTGTGTAGPVKLLGTLKTELSKCVRNMKELVCNRKPAWKPQDPEATSDAEQVYQMSPRRQRHSSLLAPRLSKTAREDLGTGLTRPSNLLHPLPTGSCRQQYETAVVPQRVGFSGNFWGIFRPLTFQPRPRLHKN